MKLLIDDTTARAHNLNANEACVFAAILKCTKAGRGWFANYRDLANALPFVISRMTVTRAVEKLLNLGLIERRENALFVHAQIEHDNAQNEHDNAQNEHDNAQNEQISISPYNPLYNNENMNENEHATCAQTCDTRTPETPSFIDLKEAYMDKGGNDNGYYIDLARVAWEKCTPAKKIKLLAAVRSGAHFKAHIHWLVTDFPEPTPTNWQGTEEGGKMLDDGRAKIALYNGRYGIYTIEDIRLLNLELSDYQRGRN